MPMPPNVPVDQKGAYEEKPLVPPEAQEIGLGKTISLQLDLVEQFPLTIAFPNGTSQIVTAYSCQFTVQVLDYLGAPLGGCDVIIEDTDLPQQGRASGATKGDGKFTGSIMGAVVNITFTVKDPGGNLLVSGDGRLFYDVKGTRPNPNQITLTAEVTLTTRNVQVPDPSDKFNPGTRAAPFKGVDASISTVGPETKGNTADNGTLTGQSGSGEALVRYTFTDTKGRTRTPSKPVP
jgi:hypothetical protein